MNNEKLIEQAFNAYATYIPKNAGPVQREETKIAFYAGAAAFFDIVTGERFYNLSEDASSALLSGIYAELDKFVDELNEKRKPGGQP